jgi:hypothetical protein
MKLTREKIQQWINQWQVSTAKTSGVTLPDFLRDKVSKANLSDDQIDTSDRDDYTDDSTPVVQMILDDLSSYANTAS